jgi:hypothetical protein
MNYIVRVLQALGYWHFCGFWLVASHCKPRIKRLLPKALQNAHHLGAFINGVSLASIKSRCSPRAEQRRPFTRKRPDLEEE